MIYKTSGVCSTEINIDIEESSEIIKSVKFTRGCEGNASGLSRLLVGMKVDDVIERLEGTTCGKKSTSCPDQLAQALKNWRASK
ncbi:MAG: TIGR03905 family TSCPD domain-containing protein [Clostridiales bacterium]|nr:TIGR03905 family TSCPD domain-containing protein [Clostridiales bacterium]